MQMSASLGQIINTLTRKMRRKLRNEEVCREGERQLRKCNNFLFFLPGPIASWTDVVGGHGGEEDRGGRVAEDANCTFA